MQLKIQCATAALLIMPLPGLLAQTPQTGSLTAKPPATAADRTALHNHQQDSFYDPDTVQTIHLRITDSDQQKMRSALPKCVYVPAVMTWKDQTFKDVGVRFKGNSSSQPEQKHKRSYLIKFSKYREQQRFLGLERISLDNGVQFGSLFSEPIITDILRTLGHKTHRCNYARLYINDIFAGVYVNAERIDETFIRRNFPGKPGGLWKNDTGGPGGDLRFVGDRPELYNKAFEAKNKQAEDDNETSELVGFIKNINGVPDDEFEQVLSQILDIDNFLETTSVMLLSGAFDQLTGWGPHNYYLYRQRESSRWHYLPWDLDVGFCEVAFGKVYVLEDWNAAWPIPQGIQIPLLERMIQNPNLLSRYRKTASRILETHFQPEELCKKLDSKFELIQEDLKKDPFPNRRATVPEDQSYEGIIASMKQFIHKRYQSAREQLLAPGQRPMPNRQDAAKGPPRELMQRFRNSIAKAENIQRKLQQIQRTMQKVNRALQQQDFEQAEKLLEEMERLTQPMP